MRRTIAEIYLKNLRHNIVVLKKLHGDHPFFCPMVKGNAYGHGDISIVKALQAEGIKHFGVVLAEEGIRLRKAGIKEKILVFGTYDRETLDEVVEFNLTPVLSDFFHLELAKNIKKKLDIHLKFNTGMNRLGFQLSEAEKVSNFIAANKNLHIEGICTHFLKGEDAGADISVTENQILKFQTIRPLFKDVPVHFLNSSALLLNFHKKYRGGARPGISIYGIKPSLHTDVDIDLRPVMQVKSFIGQLHEVPKEGTVSYVGAWKATRDSLIATIPMGYADGYPRHFSNQSEMLFRGKRVKVTGIVCMDYTMVDLTPFRNEEKINIGEEIVVFGEDKQGSYHSWQLARDTHTHPYELVTRIGERVPRVVIG